MFFDWTKTVCRKNFAFQIHLISFVLDPTWVRGWVCFSRLFFIPKKPKIFKSHSQDRTSKPKMSQIFWRKIKFFKTDFVDEKNSCVSDFRSRDANFGVSETLNDDGSGLEPVLVSSEDSFDHHLRSVGYRVVPRTFYDLSFLSISYLNLRKIGHSFNFIIIN